jgi:hypothetical protein
MGGLSKFLRRHEKIPIVGKGSKHLRVFMPSYPGPRIESIQCLDETCHHFLNHYPMSLFKRLSGGAYLNTLQNVAMADMIDDEDAVGLMMVEHDAVWPTAPAREVDGVKRPAFNAFQRLISRDKDIIGALCTNRKLPVKLMAGWYHENGDLRGVEDPALGDPQNSTPFEVDWIATHFLYVSRKAAVRIAEHVGSHLALFDCMTKVDSRKDTSEALCKLAMRYADDHGEPDEDINSQEFVAEVVKLVDMVGYYQNDISFCKRAKAAGCEIWVDPSFEVQHVGDYPYSRNDWIGQKMLEQERAEKAAAKG